MFNSQPFGRLIPIASVLLCAAARLGATSIAIANNSFETDTVSSGNYILDVMTGWTFDGDVSTFHPGSGTFATLAPDGFNVAALGGNVTISQTLNAALQPFTHYTLTAEAGARNDLNNGGYLITIDAGGNQLGSDSSLIIPSGTFVMSTVSFTTGASDAGMGLALAIHAKALNNPALGFQQTAFDFFQLDATPTTPEPSSALMVTGGLGLMWFLIAAGAGRRSALPVQIQNANGGAGSFKA